MKRILVLLLVALLPLSAGAGEYAKQDFAFGVMLNTDDQGAFYAVTLPHDVYSHTICRDLNDIKVFNSDNRVVPHELRYPPPRDEMEKARVALPFFPLFPGTNMRDTELSMRIETGSRGEIVNIEKRRSIQTDTPTSYLLDLESTTSSPAALRLEWQTESPGRLVPVIVEDSDDLLSWRRVNRAILADLVFMNSRLRHSEIALPQETCRYLRLRAEKGAFLPRLSAVEAIVSPQQHKPTRRWIELPFRIEKMDSHTFLEIEMPYALPVDGLKMEFDQPNSIVKARVLSLGPSEKWRYAGEGLFYYLSDNGNVLHNEPIMVQRHTPTRLRLELMEDIAGAELESTRIFIGYTPREVLFIARGSSPFILAYGNGRMCVSPAGKQSTAFQTLTESNDQNLIRIADIGERITLGGEIQLSIPVPNPWKKRALWLVLSAGVAILAVMAWSLMRKMTR
ncbi:MAG: DUF3999 domain-containing protein [Desulfopila sp.]|jgi:hypothetical protein|nr:DUF3999 domain-containing protein [Desulfopila sp.]